MSEKQPALKSNELNEQVTGPTPGNQPEKSLTKQEHETTPNDKNAEIEAIRQSIEQRSKSKEELIQESELGQTEEQASGPAFVDRQLKEIAYKRLLTRARRHMSSYDRLMSCIIHQPAIDKISEVTSHTIGRPSGILGGGLTAFLGTSAYYFITKHYGYSYSFSVFLILLGAGFLAGWLVEFIWRMLRSAKKR
jgi:hypothetical protein